MSVLHQSMYIFKTDLWNLSDGWANIKKKYLVYQIPIKMLKQYAIPNSSLNNLNIYSSEGPEILVKDKLC